METTKNDNHISSAQMEENGSRGGEIWQWTIDIAIWGASVILLVWVLSKPCETIKFLREQQQYEESE